MEVRTEGVQGKVCTWPIEVVACTQIQVACIFAREHYRVVDATESDLAVVALNVTRDIADGDASEDGSLNVRAACPLHEVRLASLNARSILEVEV